MQPHDERMEILLQLVTSAFLLCLKYYQPFGILRLVYISVEEAQQCPRHLGNFIVSDWGEIIGPMVAIPTSKYVTNDLEGPAKEIFQLFLINIPSHLHMLAFVILLLRYLV